MFDILQSILGPTVPVEYVSSACVIVLVVFYAVVIDLVYRIFSNFWK